MATSKYEEQVRAGIAAFEANKQFEKDCEEKAKTLPTNQEVYDEKLAAQKVEKAKTQPDLVNHPPHYTFGKFEVIDVLLDWFGTDPLLWQVGKYLARARHKGNTIQDLQKAAFYLNRAIEEEKKF